jgi:hypothetical protein
MPAATLFTYDPWPTGERRLMADVLAVAAGEVGHPVAVFILMKADDALRGHRVALTD